MQIQVLKGIYSLVLHNRSIFFILEQNVLLSETGRREEVNYIEGKWLNLVARECGVHISMKSFIQ